MALEEHEEFAMQVLEHFGGDVALIPVENSKSPDFLVRLDGVRYLVEVKAKGEDSARESERSATLESGSLASETDTAGPKNVVSGIITAAVSQLAEFDGLDYDFRVAMLIGWGRNHELYFEQFEASLYGASPVGDFGPDGDDLMRPCYYFYDSGFFRHRAVLDGAIVCSRNEGKFLVNDHSDNYESIKDSPLVRAMLPGRVDPKERERSGEAYYVDADIDRRDSEAVLRYLRQKYRREQLMNIDMHHHGVAMLVPTASDLD